MPNESSLPVWLPNQEIIAREVLLEAERGFVCPECGKKLRSSVTLKRHILDLHRVQTEQFWCKICRKHYRTKNSLVVHLCKYHPNDKGL
ncbi:broad-complex core protein isoforms 1/2/3/4/5-like [Schistocerca americana]|nr:broad-complex core protein isoforms 1/2/3/4/5-like [Schistocerca americana]XP_049957367.1 broad-complex core protein isoforms 1/2/3/4/5-like [Schistocerca serialis cubense]